MTPEEELDIPNLKCSVCGLKVEFPYIGYQFRCFNTMEEAEAIEG